MWGFGLISVFDGKTKFLNSNIRLRWSHNGHSESPEGWEAVDGGELEGVDGASVFFGVTYGAVAEERCHGLDVGAVVEQPERETVARAMPSDVLVDAGSSCPAEQHRLCGASRG